MGQLDAQRTLEEKMENVIQTFSKTLDYELALYTHAVTVEERKQMEEDVVHMMRLRKIEESVKCKLIESLVQLSSNSKDDKVKLAATVELGKVVYRERFVPKDANQEATNVKVEVYMPENHRE